MSVNIPITMKANFLAAVVTVTTLMVIIIVYLAFFDLREPPIRIIYSHPVATNEAKTRNEVVDRPVVKAGETMYAYREYCITSKYQVLRNERWLVPADFSQPSVPLPLLPTRVIRDIGCDEKAFSSEIPLGTPAGEYTFKALWVYSLKGNPIAAFQWAWPDVHVTVVKD